MLWHLATGIFDMKYYQMNGAGNAFAILDGRGEKLKLDKDAVQRIAKSANADQVVSLEHSMRGDIFMRIWNNTGDEVSACGNATRCVGWIMMQERSRDVIKIETEAGLLRASRHGNGETQISVDMGSPLLKWEEIPLSERMDTRGIDLKIGPIDDPYLQLPGCVNMGNPHCTFFTDDLDSLDIPAIGPLIEGHMLFPEKVNAGFAQVIDRKCIRLRVWERDAGLTKACGTGACAAVVAGARKQLVDRACTVLTDGGELFIEWREADDRVIMTGPVELERQALINSPNKPVFK
jgi:diaminopimelate epimerase